MEETIRGLVRRLQRLPADRRDKLVARSMPFGDIIEDDTRRVHFRRPSDCLAWHQASWGYRICRLAKRRGQP